MNLNYTVDYKLIDEMSEEQKTKTLKRIFQITQYIIKLEERFSDDHEEVAGWIDEVFQGKEPKVEGY
jgi:hypothetical protein